MSPILRALISFALLATFGHADAQNWPARPVRLIVSQAAGGAPDLIARLVADGLSRAWGQQMIVENRPGSANMVGAQAAARSAPDGYTLFFATAAALVTNPYTFKSLPYDPLRDFVPVAMIGKNPFLVLANPSVPAKNLAELVALDRAQPGKLAFATDGPKNFSGMVAAWLNKLAGTSILQVPYNAMPQGIQDTLGGRTQLIILAQTIAGPHMKKGSLKPIAVTSARKVPGLEGVPPVSDTFPGFDFVGWFALVAPSGTPQEVLRRANRDVDRVLKEPEIMQRMRDFGFFSDGAETPEALGDFIRRELVVWGKVVRAIGVEPE